MNLLQNVLAFHNPHFKIIYFENDEFKLSVSALMEKPFSLESSQKDKVNSQSKS